LGRRKPVDYDLSSGRTFDTKYFHVISTLVRDLHKNGVDIKPLLLC